jgi:hypothetical protein
MPGVSHPTLRWETPEEDALFRADFAAGSRINGLQGASVKTYRFDTVEYQFAERLTELLVEKGFLSAADAKQMGDLTQLHRYLAPAVTVLDSGAMDDISRAFFETSPGFVDTYQRLIRDVVATEVTQADCLFQRAPTIRFSFPHQQGFTWKPRFHTDVMLGHPPQGVNLWLPVCRTKGTSGMCLAPLEPSLALLDAVDLDFARFAHNVQVDPEALRQCYKVSAPVELNYGEFIAFDPRCLHAPQHNETDITRISLDFRVIGVEDHATMRLLYRGTGRRRMPFTRGGYYHEDSALTLRG